MPSTDALDRKLQEIREKRARFHAVIRMGAAEESKRKGVA